MESGGFWSDRLSLGVVLQVLVVFVFLGHDYSILGGMLERGRAVIWILWLNLFLHYLYLEHTLDRRDLCRCDSLHVQHYIEKATLRIIERPLQCISHHAGL